MPSRTPSSPLLAIGSIFGALGLVLTIVGLFVSLPRFLLVSRGASADGVVVSYESGRKAQRAVVEFKPKTGARVRITATVGSNPPTHAIGERVKVYYDPDRPDDGIIDSFLELWFFPIMLDGSGVVFLAIGAPMFFVGRRQARASARS